MLFCVFVETAQHKKIERNDNDNGKMHKEIEENGKIFAKQFFHNNIFHHFSAKCFSTVFVLLL